MIEIIVSYYLDDILIYSDNISGNTKAHIRSNLQALRLMAGFPCRQCEFQRHFREYQHAVSRSLPWPLPRSKSSRLAGTPEIKDIQSFPGFTNFYVVSFSDTPNQPLADTSNLQGLPWHFTDGVLFSLEALKRLSPSSVLTHWILDTQITVETDDFPDYVLTAVLFNL